MPPDRFGQIAVEQGLITAEQLEHAMHVQDVLREMGVKKRLGDIMATKGWINRKQIEDIHKLQGDETEKEKSEIGGYRLLGRIGRGGMSTVFKAHQVAMDRTVALKVLSPRMHEREELVLRFRREALLLARLSHPNIVQAIEVGDSDGYYYFAMEYVEGRSLKNILDVEERVPVPQALRLLRQIADAIGHLWSRRIVHGDLKPGNIMVRPDGTAKLFDLGLAFDMQTGESQDMEKGKVYGTSYYVSPEQITGARDLDVRTDIYALGITLFAMLTGELPFTACSRAIVMNKHLSEPIRWPITASRELPGSIMNLVTRMTAKERADRFQSTGELVEEIDRILDGSSTHTRYLPLYPERHFARIAAKPRHTVQRRVEAVTRLIEAKGTLDRLLSTRANNRPYAEKLAEFIPGTDMGGLLRRAIFLIMEGNVTAAREILRDARKNGYEVGALLNCIAAVQSPPDMVYIPSGPFMMGRDDGPAAEAPAREVYLPSYYIDEGLVTNVKYYEYVEATGAPSPESWGGRRPSRNIRDLPVTMITFRQARLYARWAGKRLPTEAEWEKAARGPGVYQWPWGNAWVDGRANCGPGSDGKPSVVGKYPAGISPWGCYDMAGNVTEWTTDPFVPYPGAPDGAPDRPAQYAVRGGSYQDDPDACRSTARQGLDPMSRVEFCGFRCVKDVLGD